MGNCKTCGKDLPEWLNDEYCSRRCRDVNRRIDIKKERHDRGV